MIKLLVFAAYEEAVGKRELTIDRESITLSELKEQLKREYPALPSLDNVMIAINEEYVEEDTLVKKNDVVALIPPVSGG